MPRPACSEKVSSTVAVAQTFDIDIPTDHFIHAMLIGIGEGATSDAQALADDLTDISLILNGNNYVKEMTAPMCKAISIMNKHLMSTGYYMLYFTDPKVPQAKPIPAWLFSSIILRLKDIAPAASNYHHIHATVFQSKRHDISGNWQLLVEKYLRWKKYGANTGWMDYDHERAYRIFGYLYTVDDNATLSDTEFDMLTLLGIKPDGEHRIVDEEYMSHIKEMNTTAYQHALDTGYFYMEFPDGYDSGQYRTLVSKLNIPTAATNAGLRVLERYLM